MKLIFKYSNEQIPSELYHLTTSLIGNSRIDNSPMYDIEFNIDRKLFNSILFKSNSTISNDEYFSNIRLFLRKEKTKKLLSNINNKVYIVDNEYERFSTFVQLYYENFNNIFIIQRLEDNITNYPNSPC